MSAKRHKHTFSSLWWHFGRFGRQDVHVHSCFDDGCDRVLIGKGRLCSGSSADHWRETLGGGEPEPASVEAVAVEQHGGLA